LAPERSPHNAACATARSKPFFFFGGGARTLGMGEIAAAIGEAMIIEYDFGKKERPASKRFAKPAGAEASGSLKTFGRVEAPLERASARIAKLEAALRAAHAAAAGREEADQGQILVDTAEYAALLRCRALVAAALPDA
jgi:hypothetical protein